MNSPMTTSCNPVDLEKQIGLPASRFILVRKVNVCAQSFEYSFYQRYETPTVQDAVRKIPNRLDKTG